MKATQIWTNSNFQVFITFHSTYLHNLINADMFLEILTLSPCDPLNSNPPQCKHCTVMIYMKKRDLVVFLP